MVSGFRGIAGKEAPTWEQLSIEEQNRVRALLLAEKDSARENDLIRRGIRADQGTIERRNHGDLIETSTEVVPGVSQPCIRSSGALYTLRKSGAIEDRHVAAAEMWARDYETGILGARDPEAGKSGACSDIEYAMLSRAAAVSRCQSVQRNLGEVSQRFLQMMMIDGMSVNQMHAAMNKDRMRVSGAIELLLEQLVELYDNFPVRMMAQ
ncbi:hypothetical protein AtDm6_3144 [Acetobacter tropicalis]|uniref:Uncharacterized protein n=2 Tax=Acetobacter tropicalis TaxID=104102 RepID=A0A094YKH7_9PROT|nr:hypothetical protein AtDm6_3144 [Acetobacter tropicalis]